MIERTHDKDRVNAIMKSAFADEVDFSRYAEDEAHHVLVGEHGCMVFGKTKPGIYSLTMGIKEEGRGAWATSFVENALNYMFTQTDAERLWATVLKERRDVIMLAAHATGIEIEHTDKFSFASVTKERWTNAHAH